MTSAPAAHDRIPTTSRRAVVIAWAALSAATVLGWLLSPGESQAATALGDELVAGIAVLGAIKCRLIIRYFMEVRHAPRWLQHTTDAWLAVLWLTLLGIHLA
ncbi:cytochrome C oxidase subunit IV family protein [Spirillospora sp. NPDC047279]|uniref:cytochrome C oxidase subunit IV family protein n=1 Tax=Spirillospora sp. NPDC047279 TaxID=3155478 RepID=UPI0033C5E215